MKKILSLALFLPTLAFAQTPAPDPVQDVGSEWSSLASTSVAQQGAQKHFFEALQKLASSYQDLKTENAKLKEDLQKLQPDKKPE